MSYYSELTRAMTWLGQLPNSVVLGQAVACPGTGMTDSFKDVPRDKLIEMPVAEAMQMGMATGMAIAGALPICVFPRWNFLLLATDQIVNHLDKLSLYSNGGYKPVVIIRTAIATRDPLDPGPQHIGDFSDAFRSMCRTIEVIRLERSRDIFPAYEHAAMCGHSTIIAEYSARYGDD